MSRVGQIKFGRTPVTAPGPEPEAGSEAASGLRRGWPTSSQEHFVEPVQSDIRRAIGWSMSENLAQCGPTRSAPVFPRWPESGESRLDALVRSGSLPGEQHRHPDRPHLRVKPTKPGKADIEIEGSPSWQKWREPHPISTIMSLGRMQDICASEPLCNYSVPPARSRSVAALSTM